MAAFGWPEQRIPDGWWCDEHNEIHVGKLTDWTMEHREQLHPLYAHRRHPQREDD